MRSYFFILIASFSVVILGCNDDQKNEPVKSAVKQIDEPVYFDYIPDGTYQISLTQTNTTSSRMVPMLSPSNNSPTEIRSYSEWNLTHQGDSYRFELVDIHYEYSFLSHTVIFDTRNDNVELESSYASVRTTKEGESEFSAALKALKKVKGFSFTLGKDANLPEGMFGLTSKYQLPLKSMTVANNPYSPHEEIKLHLGEEKIVPIFTMMLARPLKPMTANETYTTATGTWELSKRADKLIYREKDGDTSTVVVDAFDYNNHWESSDFQRFKSTKKDIKFGNNKMKMITSHTHAAEIEIRRVNDKSAQ
ncbi:hypothetical protein [Vibrio rhizosphaerae]|uniref:Uncharacterized protein n=1 Tax=Vibrio rhizosphaerae TaxID=398736 RepID=A0ABU4ISF8_9VIBR|nr:hypothetical protein [Vibrio rhizosphaerae]MDW6092219.1 hypothetical protein [Vibrio rhizosphaerae]